MSVVSFFKNHIPYYTSYFYCRETFCTKYNFGFGQPRSDTCSKCDELHTQLSATEDVHERERIRKELEMHHRKAGKGYQMLKDETKKSQESWNGRMRVFGNECCTVNATDMYTFDFEQNLPLPTLTHSDVFYCRQLWVYNFGVHDCVSNKGIMHLWDETSAKRDHQKLHLV